MTAEPRFLWPYLSKFAKKPASAVEAHICDSYIDEVTAFTATPAGAIRVDASVSKMSPNAGRFQTTVENVSALTTRAEVIEDQILRARSRVPSPLRKHALTEFDPRSPLLSPAANKSLPDPASRVSFISPRTERWRQRRGSRPTTESRLRSPADSTAAVSPAVTVRRPPTRSQRRGDSTARAPGPFEPIRGDG